MSNSERESSKSVDFIYLDGTISPPPPVTTAPPPSDLAAQGNGAPPTMVHSPPPPGMVLVSGGIASTSTMVITSVSDPHERNRMYPASSDGSFPEPLLQENSESEYAAVSAK